MLPIWTLPYECELCDKMQVYKELTCDWVKSKVVKANLTCRISKTRENCVKTSLIEAFGPM